MGDPREERTFIHDMASPLTSLQLNLENVIMVLEDGKPEDLATAKTITQSCMKQIKKMTDLMQQRRTVLIQEAESK